MAELQSIVSLNEASALSLNEITDESLVGIHTIGFEAYLVNLDPEATLSKPLDLVMTVEIVKPEEVLIGETFADELVLDEGPIATSTIEKSYTIEFDQYELFSFEFASALTLKEDDDVELGDLEIKVTSNTLADAVSVISTEYAETGLGMISL